MLLRLAAEYPFRPAVVLRRLGHDSLRFAVVAAVIISATAGFRAGMARGEVFSISRLGTSLFGFVLISACAWWIGKRLGGRAEPVLVAAALVGSGIPFILVDALWIVMLAAGSDDSSIARIFERASWLWALILLVVGIADVQGFSRVRAAANVLGVALLGAVPVLAVLALR